MKVKLMALNLRRRFKAKTSMSEVTTSIFSTPKQVTNIVAIRPVSGSVPSTTKKLVFHKHVLKVTEIFTKGVKSSPE